MTCAGSAGHINPAIAIANIFKENFNSEILFICSKTGIENDLVKNAGYDILNISTGKLIRRVTIDNIKNIFNMLKGIKESKKILKEFIPDIVVGTGGYICMSVLTASKQLKIPYIIHESNVVPGLSTKLLAKGASKILTGYDIEINNSVCVGNPVIFNIDEYDKLDKYILKKKYNIPDKDIVLVYGGSQGAQIINDILINLIRVKKDKTLFFILITGKTNFIPNFNKAKGLEEYIKVIDYAYDIFELYKISDMCVTRAGALTINELKILNKPAVLIPLKTSAENHQLYNATLFEKNKYGALIQEEDLNFDRLYNKVKNILFNKEIYIKKMEKESKIDVNANILNEILKVVK
ncbi:MAG: UDP-N-acetylglucosamine--N-acetylmuramyl-(pentapeptide) pyrophosphoryl-undecaprenol N-acetylglucosamine transferase [Clostridia bacterium]